uniref:Pseudouridine synthase RsuA/RluA-like domain-containing protein n=1 Tax=Sus scrofa TaxID=9823 RepID=A0A4X1UUB7_PIG
NPPLLCATVSPKAQKGISAFPLLAKAKLPLVAALTLATPIDNQSDQSERCERAGAALPDTCALSSHRRWVATVSGARSGAAVGRVWGSAQCPRPQALAPRPGPLVTLNKPQGLPVTGKPGELTLVSVLPELSQCLGLGERELQVVRASGKETSGLVLLSSCPQTASRLQKFFTHSQRARKPTATYCAVTDGIPAASEGKIQAALKMEHTDGASLVVPVKSPSRKDFLKGVKWTLSHFRVLASGSGCALVQLQPLTAFPSQLQVHMVLQLCPVLGDHKYSACVGTVLGQRFLLPAENTKPQRQVLDEALLSRLHLTPAQAAQLPLHIHLHRLHLPGTRPRDAPIELLAPLPSYFSRTLQCLGLQYQ